MIRVLLLLVSLSGVGWAEDLDDFADRMIEQSLRHMQELGQPEPVPQYVPVPVPVYPQYRNYTVPRAPVAPQCRVVCVGTRCEPVCW